MDKIPNYIVRGAKNKDILISVRIGHEGLSDAIVMELSNQLNNRPLVKVKANQGVAETSEKRKILFNSLASESKSILVFNRGNTAVYWAGK
ncbi:MAG: YhbY family RNA-binding protein [Candidatus Poseidoniales archaeon]|jgi:RNA-binding protein YhbY|tara:strand:+ start:307 stop:579 length:273 start_codon:yes stop_codon:yes gene_type:complete